MSDLVSYSQLDGVATLTLAHGKVNVVSPGVIAEFNAALDQAEANGAVVILTGQPGILSGGYGNFSLTYGNARAIAALRMRVGSGAMALVKDTRSSKYSQNGIPSLRQVFFRLAKVSRH